MCVREGGGEREGKGGKNRENDCKADTYQQAEIAAGGVFNGKGRK